VHYHRSDTAAEDGVAEIIRSGGAAVALAADLATVDQVDDLLDRAAAALGPVTCLINNAAIFERDTATTATAQSWDRHLAINLRAPFFLSQALVRQLPPDAAGNIINLIDQRVWNLSPTYTSYTVSKAGLWTLTRTLAMALAPRIRVNGVGPGPTLPNRGQTAAQFAAESRATPLGHGAALDDICAAVRYLLSADAVTGQMIVVDGGQHLPRPPP
jgi:NAD(P)-dependent dehydrogenase (short-subunit alcohol dehydrogenase family)